jgi:hypothetical protein
LCSSTNLNGISSFTNLYLPVKTTAFIESIHALWYIYAVHIFEFGILKQSCDGCPTDRALLETAAPPGLERRCADLAALRGVLGSPFRLLFHLIAAGKLIGDR